MVDVGRNTALAAKVRRFAVGIDVALITVVIAWQFSAGWSSLRALFAILLTLPLCTPLPGLYRANRRTFAWTTLCVIPYLVIGITETVARPNERAWTGLCLGLALTLFVTLIAYLRVTRESFIATSEHTGRQ